MLELFRSHRPSERCAPVGSFAIWRQAVGNFRVAALQPPFESFVFDVKRPNIEHRVKPPRPKLFVLTARVADSLAALRMQRKILGC
jgi:hypothetical protein